MFSKKEKALESLSNAYAKAVADPDCGNRLLQLKALEQKLQKTIAEPGSTAFGMKATAITVFAGAGIGLALGSFGIINAPAVPLLMETTLYTLCGGAAGGLTDAMRRLFFGDAHDARSRARNQLKYVTNVVPVLPQLKALELRIEQDIKTQISPEHAHDLLQSARLKDVLAAYPKLASVFKEAQLKKPLPALPAPQEPKSQKKSLQL